MIEKIGEKGAAAVETALVLPVLLLFIFAIFEYGRALFTLNTLGNAARAGARTAVVTAVVAGNDWKAAATTAAKSAIYMGDPTKASVCVTASPNDPPKTGDTVTVTTTLPYDPLVGFIPVPASLTGRASMRYE